MKILQVAHDYSLTGAGIAAARLHQGLLKIGLDSQMVVRNKAMGDACPSLPEKKLLSRTLDRLAVAVDQRFSTQGLTNYSAMRWNFVDRDVLNFHSICMPWFNLHRLPKLARRHVLVLTMHDMSYGTAVCHYTGYFGDCTNWKTGCGHCPAVAANPHSLRDISRWIFRRKQHLFHRARVTIVTPSTWMQEFAEETPMLKGLRIEHIPNGIDTDLFKPMGKAYVRQVLELPIEKRLLAFIASNPGNPRKGFQHLPPLFERLKDLPDLGLVVVGDLKPDKAAEIEEFFPVYYLGVLRDPRLMRMVYAASDLFLIPSEADNLPNTMLESLACGTPVVAFAVGGIPDGVKNDETGFTAPLGEYDSLACWIREMLKNPEAANRLRENCRRFALENFALERQATRYQALYESLLEERRGSGMME